MSVEQHLEYVDPDESAHAKRYCAISSKTATEEKKVVLFLNCKFNFLTFHVSN